MLKYLIEKEFKQIIRNPFIPKILIVMPLISMFVFPFAANMEIKNINLAVIDMDKTPYSRELVQKSMASDYFAVIDVFSSYNDAIEAVEYGDADIILEIPRFFERDIIKEHKTDVLIAANSVNGIKGGLGSSYLASIVNDFSVDIREKTGVVLSGSSAPVINIVPQNRYNQFLDYKIFMIPALMVMIITIFCGFLPTLNIVNEKEQGTIEQINVSPIGKKTFIFAKLFPYWVIGFLVLSISMAVVYFVFGLVPVGNIFTIYFFTTIYILVMSGMGLVVSNNSSTMQQAMFVNYFFIMVLVLMSGLFTPISSMPDWAQKITIFNPLKYYIQVMRMVYLKGSDITHLIPQLITLSCFAVVFNVWAILSYKKTN